MKYRQQIIYEKKNLTIINDSKSTSFASSENLLKSLNKVYWILGGIPKKNDKFRLAKKNCKNFKAFIFGNNVIEAIKDLNTGEILLVAGKGHETIQEIGKKKIFSSDKKIILNAIKKKI